MTKEENRALCERFPFLLPRNRWSGEVASGYDFEYTELDAMPDGWRKAFGEQLCEELLAELTRTGRPDDYRILQIKEKYGSLRWYDNWNTEHGYEILDQYEALSRHTCIRCGAPATRITTGWISPYCDACCPDNSESVPIGAFYDEIKEEECF